MHLLVHLPPSFAPFRRPTIVFGGIRRCPPHPNRVFTVRSDTLGFSRSWIDPFHRILHPCGGLEQGWDVQIRSCGRGWEDLIENPTPDSTFHPPRAWFLPTWNVGGRSYAFPPLLCLARRGLVSIAPCVLDVADFSPPFRPDSDVPCGGGGPQARVVQLRRSREVTAMAMAPTMALPCTRASWPTSRARRGKTCHRMLRTNRRRLRPPTSAEVRAGSKARTSTSRNDVWDRKDGVLLEDRTSADGFET